MSRPGDRRARRLRSPFRGAAYQEIEGTGQESGRTGRLLERPGRVG
ncbi:hypothetical protein AB0D83_30400 [Streptomyces decoyicus]